LIAANKRVTSEDVMFASSRRECELVIGRAFGWLDAKFGHDATTPTHYKAESAHTDSL
jgi:hypothetical protein